MFETLLLNFLFILLPVVIFLIFFENRSNSFNKIILIFLSTVTMVLCMTIPIKLNVGFNVDLRYIPVIIVALFGGYKKVFPLYIVLNIYRYYLGGDGILQSFLYSTGVIILLPAFSQRFKQLSSKRRISTADNAPSGSPILF
ncbi:LytS/YhcK type 5TM receptor domain-containing protein [Bacillus sp. 1P10SD]|uniref:LytS/YhcK type 5TM receptor domain-containing protein n=1 Tax=Bacillus sp. 1P10SD TaxID=3132265 RepID=UPI0039A6A2D6